MEAQFTPATLFAHDDSFINKDGKRVGVIRITDLAESGGKWIGEVPSYGIETGNFPDHEEAKAYATLFAAAPELLEALKLALPYIEGAYECAFPDSDHNDNVLTMAREAIEKATGK
jgi:hypothetical protein